jgi:hypothetical protein
MGQKTLSPYRARIKKFFRFSEIGQKHLRAFDEQMFETVVLDTWFLETKVKFFMAWPSLTGDTDTFWPDDSILQISPYCLH